MAIFATPRRFLCFLLGYFALHVFIRTALGGAANLDEAEQLFLGQKLSLGYGPQPPLYTWLQIPIFGVAGQTIFALALLKNALLFTTYTLAYLNARFITGRHSTGVVAALSLFFIPQIAWESQRDLTHSVLASTLALVTLYVVLQLCRGGGRGWFLCLGAAVGAGVLAKYNYALWAVGLLAAGLWIPETRVRLMRPGLFVALGLAVAIVAPHMWWGVENRDLALASASKFEMVRNGNWVWVRLVGLVKLVWAAIAFVLPFAAIFGALVFLARKRFQRNGSEMEWEAAVFLRSTWPGEVKIIFRAVGVIGLMLIAGVILFAITGIKDRWFQPILICIPVAMASMLAGENRLLLDGIQRISLVVMLVVSLLIPGKVIFAGQTGQSDRLNWPFRDLGRQLASQVDKDTVLIADTQLLAGNLRLSFPQNEVILSQAKPPKARNWVLVWDARQRPKPPKESLEWALQGSQQSKFLEAPLRYNDDKKFRLGFIKPKQNPYSSRSGSQ